jgi:hypothetical protein
MVDRQQQADNDGDYYGLSANLLGSTGAARNGWPLTRGGWGDEGFL